MPATINYLSIEVTIGGQTFALETDDPKREIYKFGDVANTAQDKIKSALRNGLSFKMEEGKIISVTIGELIDWIGKKIDESMKNDLYNFFKAASDPSASPLPTSGSLLNTQNKLLNTQIILWNLAIRTESKDNTDIKLSFTFYVKVALESGFFNGIFGTNSNFTKIIDINSVGFGLTFSN